MNLEKFVTYDGLPISAGGAHSLGNSLPRDIYQKTINFLQTYSDIKLPSDTSIILYKSQAFDYKSLKWQLHKNFGLFPKTSIIDFPNEKKKSWTWNVSSKETEKAIYFLEQWKGLPALDIGPLSISILWNFKLIDPTTNKKLPNQDLIPVLDQRLHNSRILLTLQRKSTISAWFAFPFDNHDEHFNNFIQDFNKSLPFRVSDKHWRIWQKNKNGDWYPKKIKI